jgi:2-C-methyl-D-erythritol 4-phosphate cytidylyltransferase
MPNAHAIIVAAGKGLRMRAQMPKQYLPLNGIPVLARTIGAFARCPHIGKIIVVIPPGDQPHCRQHILPLVQTEKAIRLVEGGRERQDSVFNALNVIREKTDLVAIHDGVRPMITTDQITACITAADNSGACIMALPVTDTVKQVTRERTIARTVDRSDLWLAQTPQVFRHEIILEAHRKARREGFIGSDDAMLVERAGHPVRVVRGHKDNLKLTTQEDIALAEYLLKNA